jgi:hypothetical protein
MADLKQYWEPEEAARFDRLYDLGEGILVECGKLEEAPLPGEDKGLANTLRAAAQAIYKERQRLIAIARARAQQQPSD